MSFANRILDWLRRALAFLRQATQWAISRWWQALQQQSGLTGKALVGCGGLLTPLIACTILSIPFMGRGSHTPTPAPQLAAETQPAAVRQPTSTPKPTNTPQPTDTPAIAQAILPATSPPTNTPRPTNTPQPTKTPAPPTPTPAPPTPTSTPQPDAVVLSQTLNVRSGPGTMYDRLGSLSQGDTLKITGRNADASWLVIAAAGGLTGWISSSPDLVRLNIKPMTTVPLAQIPPTPTPAPRPIRPPTAAPANCHPSYPDVCIPPPPPDLDCKDIRYRRFRVLPPDPHGFDSDHDGIGCEG